MGKAMFKIPVSACGYIRWVEVDKIDIVQRCDGCELMKLVPDKIAHEAGGKAPVWK